MAIETRIKQGKKVFANWEVEEYIGSGSGGRTAVFRIVRKHENWEETSALKVVNVLEEIGNKNTLAETYIQEYETERRDLCRQAEEELRLMSCLRGNPNIVEYYDFIFIDYQEDNVFGTDLLIRMELLENLREEQKKKGEYSEAEIIRIGKNICKGLRFCHQAGIIHRDIKPANIFVTEWGEYKLGDFGIARMVDAGQKASTKMGTRAYAAPEQFMSHEDKYDERVDIYSLGLTLYELANNNRLPFANSGYVRESEIQLRILGKEFPAPENAGPELTEVIKKACAHKAENRYDSVEQFKEALGKAEVDAFYGGELEIDTTKNLINEQKENVVVSKRSGKKIIVAMLLLIVSVTFLIGLLFTNKKDDNTVTVTVTNEETSTEVSEDNQSAELQEEIIQKRVKVETSAIEYAKMFGEIKSVTATNDNVAVISKDHKLYMWGVNEYGQVGCGNTDKQNEPVMVLENVESVYLSEFHTAALTRDGELYLWGRNSNGQIGNGLTKNQLTPVLVLENVIDVSLADYSSTALCFNGDLYAWGGTNGTNKEQLKPNLILENVDKFSIDTQDGGAVTESGQLFVWGMNWNGFKGFGNKKPKSIRAHVKDVYIGEHVIGIIDRDGVVYTWGDGKHGQLGNGESQGIVEIPTKVFENAESIVMGTSGSASITKDGELYMWGSNISGELGLDGGIEFTTPQKVDDSVKTICLGDMLSAYIKENGDLYVCGFNHFVGLEEGPNSEKKKHLAENISSVAISGDTVYAVSAEGSMYRWEN